MKTPIINRPGLISPPGRIVSVRPVSSISVTAVAAEPEDYIGKPEVAKRLGCSLRTLDNWMKRKLIPFFKIGSRVAFKWSEVETHLSQHCRAGRGVGTPATGTAPAATAKGGSR